MSVNFFNNKPSFPAKSDQGAKMTVQGGAFGGSGRRNAYYAPDQGEEGYDEEEKYDDSSHHSSFNAKKFFKPEEAEEVFGDVYEEGSPLPPLSSDWESA